MSKVWIGKLAVSAMVFVLAGFLTGCQEANENYAFRNSIHKKPLFEETKELLAGKSVQGRDIKYTVHGNGSDVVLIIGGIHGNEPAGVKIVQKLDKILNDKPYKAVGKTIVLLPIANPDGYAKNSRYNANNVDLNRNFSTNNRVNSRTNGSKGLTEPESVALFNLINKYNPQKIISIHSPLGCVDYDGPGGVIAYRMSRACDLPVRKLGSRPGSLGSYAGIEKGIPIVTLEATKTDDSLSDDMLWAKYGQAMFTAINHTIYAK